MVWKELWKLVNRFTIKQLAVLTGVFGFLSGLSTEVITVVAADCKPIYAEELGIEEIIAKEATDDELALPASTEELHEIVDDCLKNADSEPAKQLAYIDYDVFKQVLVAEAETEAEVEVAEEVEEVKEVEDTAEEQLAKAIEDVPIAKDELVEIMMIEQGVIDSPSADEADEAPTNDIEHEDEPAIPEEQLGEQSEASDITIEDQLLWTKNHIYYWFTEEDIREITLVIQAEDEVSQSDTEWAAHAWVILTRLSDGRFGETVHDILTSPGQFPTYNGAMTLDPNPAIGRVVVDVMARWVLEEHLDIPSEDVGRVVPASHLYWHGNSSGTHNIFTTSCTGSNPYHPIEDAANITPYDT